ncbi:hypothetical protein ABZ646_17340 [Streptomyces sp. NPDC007162]|uniref:hypothetical protein n=1 Tax=Streptomyces sp. NPDC007162 TaxID=3156917 RepID=UPI0033F926EB
MAAGSVRAGGRLSAGELRGRKPRADVQRNRAALLETAQRHFELLAAARRLGEPAAVVVSATGLSARLKEELARHGATRIYAVESADADDYVVTPTVGALELAAREASPAAVLVPATVEGNEVAARLAVRLDAGLLVDAVELVHRDLPSHPRHAGHLPTAGRL